VQLHVRFSDGKKNPTIFSRAADFDLLHAGGSVAAGTVTRVLAVAGGASTSVAHISAEGLRALHRDTGLPLREKGGRVPRGWREAGDPCGTSCFLPASFRWP